MMLVLAVFLLSGLAAPPAFPDLRAEFREAYLLIREADRLAWEEEAGQARETYRRALRMLDGLSDRHPDWNHPAIEKWTGHCARNLWTRLPDAVGRRGEITGRKLSVAFIDVGQGDSVLIECPGGEKILVDGGPRDAGKKVVDYLRRQGVRELDLLIATHPHSDHIGGLPEVVRNFPVKKFIDPGKEHTTRDYEELLLLVRDRKIFYELGRAGNEYRFGEVRLRILSPPGELFDDINDCSVVTELRYGDIAILLPGDAGEEAELRMVSENRLSRCQVVQPAHHGSRHSTGEDLLHRLRPEAAVISCGRDNPFGHPRQEVLDRLEAAGCDIHRTDQRGDIRVETDGSRYQVILERREERRAPPGVEREERARLESEKININMAHEEHLVELPGIGPVKAKAIVDHRREHGPFERIEDIVNVRGIGPRTFERLEDRITVMVGKALPPRRVPRKVASTAARAESAEERREERLTSLPPSVAAYRFPEITPEELAWRPEGERISVDLLNDRDYFRRVNRLIREARESIYIVMFVINPGESGRGRINELLGSLAGARRRGVRVRVILNRDPREDEFVAVANARALAELQRAGIEVEYDHPRIKTHDKLLVVDRRYTVVGAHNWTEAAMSSHYETSVLIESEGTAREYLAYFHDIQAQTERLIKMGW